MRIFVDVTAIYFHGNRSGIPRLVQKITDHLSMHDVEVAWFVHAGRSLYCVPVRGFDNPPFLSSAKSRLRKVLLLWIGRPASFRAWARAAWMRLCAMRLALGALCGRTPRLPLLSPHDIVLLVEGAGTSTFFAGMQAHCRDALVLAIVSDLFPLRYPNFYSKKTGAAFAEEFLRRVAVADALICNSKETTKSVHRFLAERNFSKPVTHLYLGADFETPDLETSRTPSPPRAASFARRDVPVVLSVSSIEPRKNYEFALALCTRLWSEGHDFRYVIVGATGWMSRDFVRAMRCHPEWGRRLIYRGPVSDRELLAVYRTSQFFLNTSIDEGFGIPVMEAFRHNLRVICSDIPIFREVCADHAQFIPLDDIAVAAERVGALLRQEGSGEKTAYNEPWPHSPPGMTSWRECAATLLREISHHRPAGRPRQSELPAVAGHLLAR